MRSYKDFTTRERHKILEDIKRAWKEGIKDYKALEQYQIKNFGGICFKATTLKSKASKEKWNNQKGKANRDRINKKKKEFIQLTEEDQNIELLEKIGSDDYLKVVQGIGIKYKEDFKKVRSQLAEGIKDENIKKIKCSEVAIRALRSARKLELELIGFLDIEEQRRLEVELLRVEMLALEKDSKIR